MFKVLIRDQNESNEKKENISYLSREMAGV